MGSNILKSHVFQDHVLLGAVVAILLVPFWSIRDSAVFWLVSILVDVDHGFRYLSLTHGRDWNPLHMLRYFERAFELRHHPDFVAIEVFHTVEFGAILSVMTAHFAPVLMPVYLGYLFHMIVDAIHLRHYEALTKRCYSFWEYEQRTKVITEGGGHPGALHLQALRESQGK